jgi:subtilisin family serine protease
VSARITANGDAKILKTFKSEVFAGLSVESETENVDTLQAVAEITRAWPMAKIKLAPITPSAVFSDDAAAANYSVHASTGVDKAHEAGIFGKGVKVAVVDTGTYYTHPAVSDAS